MLSRNKIQLNRRDPIKINNVSNVIVHKYKSLYQCFIIFSALNDIFFILEDFV